MRKWAIRGAIGILVILIVGYVALQAYLATPHATRLVASKLEPIVGGPVQIDRIALGVGGSDLSGVRIFAEGGAEPWLSVEKLRTDVSLFDLIGGAAMPRTVTVAGAALILEIDRDGQILTRFPETNGNGASPERLPDVRLESASLLVRQESKPEARFRSIDATLRHEEQTLRLDGTLDDPEWGNWSVGAELQDDGSSGSLSLRTDSAQVTQEKLRSIPFVPNEVWDEVRAEGVTPAEVEIDFGGSEPDLRYRVRLRPTGARVFVDALDMELTEASGGVTIDGPRVLLTGVKGSAAGGTFSTEADLDFRDEVSKLSFQVRAEAVDVNALPESWNFPSRISGRLHGKADLELTIGETVAYDGSGEGEVRDARLGNIPFDGPVGIRLTPTAEGFRFGQGEVSSADPVTTRLFMPWTALLIGQAPDPDPEPAADSDAGLLEINFGFRDIELAQLFEQIEMDVPFEVSGRLTTRVTVGIPSDDPTDLRKYRLDGTAELSTFTIEGVRLDRVTARVNYRDGVLTLEEFRGDLPGEGDQAGRFDGRARLGVSPAGDLSADLTLDEIPWSNLAGITRGFITDPAGTFSGRIEFTAPAGNLTELAKWTGSATVSSDELKGLNWSLTKPRTVIELGDGSLRLTEFSGDLQGIRFGGKAEMALEEPYRFQGELDLAESDLAAVNQLAPEVRPPLQIQGRLSARTTVSGTLSPLEYELGGTATLKPLKLDQFTIGSANFRWLIDERAFRFQELRADLYGGTLTGSAEVPLEGEDPGRVDVRFRGVDLARLSGDIKDFPVPLEGVANGTVVVTIPGGEGQPRTEFELEAPRLRVRGIPAEELKGTAVYEDGWIRYEAEGALLGGTFEVDGRYPLAVGGDDEPAPAEEPEPSGSVRLFRLNLAPLLEAFGLGDDLGPLDGRLDLRFNYSGSSLEGLSGTGDVTIVRLNWAGREITPSLQARLGIANNRLRIDQVRGGYAGGRLDATIGLALTGEGPTDLRVSLQGADAVRLFALVPALDGQISGTVNLSLDGRVGERSSGRGSFEMPRGTILDAPVSAMRLPLNWRLTGRGGEVSTTGGSATIASGRVRLRTTYSWGDSPRLNGRADFTEIDLARLLKPYTQSSFTKGRATGRLDFGGGRVNTINDLNATLTGRLRQTQASGLPIIGQIERYVPMLRNRSVDTQDGNFDIRLSRGVFRVLELSLASKNLLLFIDGIVTTAGRLDLNVIASIEPINPGPLLRLVGYVIPVGPIPATVLLDAAKFLAARTFQFHVTGTTRNPVIRFTPVRNLSEQGVRFFLRGLTGG